jgi:DUF4097 and DUF4098 domain-containing protein YvlB
MPKATRLLLLALFVLALLPASASAEWEDCDGYRRDRDWGGEGRYCEIRELELAALPRLAVDAGRNGGIVVEAWDDASIRVEARVSVWNVSEEEARQLAAAIRVGESGGVVSAEGDTDRSWSVSYRIQAPRLTDLDLEAHNGGISVEGIEGVLRMRTQNGGLSLAALAGDVEASTANGGVHVELAGSSWEGDGLDVETRNGGVKLEIPEEYSAELETGTVNGRIRVDFPITVQGSIGKEIRATLGSGGAPVRVRTTNGGVTVSHS